MSDSKTTLVGSPLLTFVLILSLILTVYLEHTYKSPHTPGTILTTLPALKIARGEKHDKYPTNPPTSGWYYESNLHDGIYSSKIADEEIVSALVKGKIVIIFNCQYKSKQATPSPQPSDIGRSGAPAVQSVEDKTNIVRQINEQNKNCGETNAKIKSILDNKGTKDILFVPYPTLDTRIAILAYGIWDKMFWLDEDRINQFIDAYRGVKPQ